MFFLIPISIFQDITQYLTFTWIDLCIYEPAEPHVEYQAGDIVLIKQLN